LNAGPAGDLNGKDRSAAAAPASGHAANAIAANTRFMINSDPRGNQQRGSKLTEFGGKRVWLRNHMVWLLTRLS
jgi:hypothetical protein